MSDLAKKLLAIHDALEAASLPHAIGGAIALAYCVEEPRGTRDIDVNVFLPTEEAPRVLRALPPGVSVSDDDIRDALRDGQVRVWWDDTPVDVFLDVHGFHTTAARDVRVVPFAGSAIPVLGCTSLAVFKIVFNRRKDWADIEAMVGAGALDTVSAVGWAVQLFGREDDRVTQLLSIVEGPS